MTDLKQLIERVPGLAEKANSAWNPHSQTWWTADGERELYEDDVRPRLTAAAVEMALEKGWYIEGLTDPGFAVLDMTEFDGMKLVVSAPTLLEACVAALAGEGSN